MVCAAYVFSYNRRSGLFWLLNLWRCKFAASCTGKCGTCVDVAVFLKLIPEYKCLIIWVIVIDMHYTCKRKPQKAHRYRQKSSKHSNLKYFQLCSYYLSNLFISLLSRFLKSQYRLKYALIVSLLVQLALSVYRYLACQHVIALSF